MAGTCGSGQSPGKPFLKELTLYSKAISCLYEEQATKRTNFPPPVASHSVVRDLTDPSWGLGALGFPEPFPQDNSMTWQSCTGRESGRWSPGIQV